jgi:hypothetical protein
VAKEAEATLVTNEVTKEPERADHIHIQFGNFNDKEDLNFTFLQHADCRSVMMNQGSGTVPKAWILLDNQSTVDVLYYNKKLLQNIRKAKKQMDIHCNAGVITIELIGDLPG